MFNFTTTTIVNSLYDFTAINPETGKKDLPLITKSNGCIHFKRDLVIEPRWVESVYKRSGYEPTNCKMSVDMNAVAKAIDNAVKAEKVEYPVSARLAFYIVLDGSEEHLYANDWYQKGKPFCIGFSMNDSEVTGAELAEAIVKADKKYHFSTYGKKMFNLTSNEATLTIDGTHEYQRIKMAAVIADDDFYDIPVAKWEYAGEEDGNVIGKAFTSLNRGVNGFGTSHQLVKDLRLPTAAHWKWNHVPADETPIQGAVYTQYIITYYAPVQTNPSFTSVGNRSLAETTHIFWVKSDLVEKFEEAIEPIKPTDVDEKAIEDGQFSKTTEINKFEAEEKTIHNQIAEREVSPNEGGEDTPPVTEP